jgi:hypothetical protein
MLATSATQPSVDRLPRRLLAAVSEHAATLLPAVLDWLARGRADRLVLFLPVLLLPAAATAQDLWLSATLFLLVAAIEAGLAPARPNDKSGLAVGALAWLVGGLVLGTGSAMALALFVLVRSIEARVPEALWPIRLGLAALATALLADLALIALALERSSVWLALAAAIGIAIAAARELADRSPAPDTLPAGSNVYLEATLITAACFVLALYSALLAHEPALARLEGGTRFLALPFLAAALAQLIRLGLGPAGHERRDPLALLLLAAWALASLVLGDLAAVV